MKEQASLSCMSKAGEIIPVLRFCGEWSLVSGLDLLAFLPFFLFFYFSHLSCADIIFRRKTCIDSYGGLLGLHPLTKRDS